jgi:ribose 5-phosphate isomerase B
MTIVFGADHAGFEMKQSLMIYVRQLGHEVLDVGTHNISPVDYPDYAEDVGMTLRNLQSGRGVLICGSGIGASVAANKIPGIRAGLCHDAYSAHQGVEHDDMNVLVLGSRVIGVELARDLVDTFLRAQFSGEERHLRRVDKVRKLEEKFAERQNGQRVEKGSDVFAGVETPEVIVTGSATGFAQEIAVGPHRLKGDEPTSVGGTGTGPSPYDFLLAALGSCTSMTVGMYARRKGWPLEHVTVWLRHSKVHAADCADCETKEGMLDRIERDIHFSGSLTSEQQDRLLEIANKCPVHRTLTSEIDIRTIAK